jgi:N-acyl-D-aspartate/D-glutamate deacylase
VQADLFRFADRGVLRPGAYADVVVFDAASIAPGPTRRVRDFPANGERLTADQPTGIHRVIVNGRTVVEDGKLDERAVADRPGVWVAPSPRIT